MYRGRFGGPAEIGRVMKRLAILLWLAAVTGCSPNPRIMNSAAETPVPVTSAPVEKSFDNDLESMRNADFKFILVFRKRDGEVLDPEDKAFINANTPADVNRRKLSDNGKAVIIGTNFPFLPGMIEKLTSRFVMEDHSKVDSGPLEVDPNAKASPSSSENR